MFKGKYGISFSWNRLLGISGLKNKIARKTGVPTTKFGLQRKIGSLLLSLFFGKNK